YYIVAMEYQHERPNVHLVVYHLIWCSKRRRTVLVGPVPNRLEQIIKEVVDENGWQIIQLAIQPDHVHLFIRSHPYTIPTPTTYPTAHQGAQLAPLAKGVSTPAQAAVALDALVLSEHGW